MYNEKREIERQIEEMIRSIFLDSMCRPGPTGKPGEFIKRYKSRFPLMDKFKSEHFQHRIK